MDSLYLRQMLRGQRRSKAFVRPARIMLAHQLQGLFATLLVNTIRAAADAVVHQRLGPTRPIALLEPLRSAVAESISISANERLRRCPGVVGSYRIPSKSFQ